LTTLIFLQDNDTANDDDDNYYYYYYYNYYNYNNNYPYLRHELRFRRVPKRIELLRHVLLCRGPRVPAVL
jgi:hypothetical protein